MISQLIINALIAASIYVLVGVGFGLMYRTIRFIHFSHGVIITLGPYYVYLINVIFGWPIWVSIVISIILCSFSGCLMETFVYSQIRRKKAPDLVLIISSLGLYIAVQNAISLFFGDETKTIRTNVTTIGIDLMGGKITKIQILAIAISLLLVSSVALLLKYTKVGKAIRAVANNQELALLSGIDCNRVFLWTTAIGSALAGIAGILIAYDTDFMPTMGMNLLMMGVVAVIIGGAGSFAGIALGGILLAIAQQFSAWFIGSQWQDSIAFIILILFLFLRPEGFLGKVKKV